MNIQRDLDDSAITPPGEDSENSDVTDPDENDEDSNNTGSNEDDTPNGADSDKDNTGSSNENDDSEDITAPVITPIPDGSAIENEPMGDIMIETDEPSNVTVDGLPDGVTYDADNHVIGGIPVVND